MSFNSISTISQFAEACSTLSSEAIYELFEFNLHDEMRDKIYEVADPHSAEPARNAFNEIGKLYSVQSLIDY